MTKEKLKDLLDRASSAVGGYASAIDGHLYRVSNYYAEQEQEMRDLANELDLASLELDEQPVTTPPPAPSSKPLATVRPRRPWWGRRRPRTA